ncbi:MAG: chromate transporter [Ruminococcaceae bacterium]|nr:chromate transporter [Oscillospiraceae bacterium]
MIPKKADTPPRPRKNPLQKNILTLFLTFFKIGLFTFGGGYAMLSIIDNICVERKKWITHDEMMNITVIAESTPGPIAINCSTFVGYKQAGLWGALAATFGVVLPSFVIIYLISMVFDNFLQFPVAVNALRGVKIAVGLLIFSAAVNMMRKMKKTPLSSAILAVSAVVMLAIEFFSLKFSTVSLMLIAAAVSLCVFLAEELAHGKDGERK